MCALAALCGCPPPAAPDGTTGGVVHVEASATATASAPEPEPTASAAVEAPLRGGWSIAVTSASPGVDPALFDTPEKKAAAFYDHQATVVAGKARVAQRTLGKSVELDAGAGKQLEDAVLRVDWKKLAVEAPRGEGGTVFTFTVAVGGESFVVKVGKLKEHPELKAIADALKSAAGAP